ncbi:MAG TPA: WYL domain-containing protein [Acidimicrobiales bacterium]|nr:WYL domain-containing protein [Acidimicrobiales bacterium]
MPTRADAGHRLHRLLAVLTWLARRGRAPVADLASRFGLGPEELIADLELAACCGLPPYTPDQLMEIIVDEDEVVANLGPELARPRRLTAAEGFALATAGRAIAAVPGADPDGALARGLDKLDALLGTGDRLRIDLDDPPHLAALRRAADTHQAVELAYYSASSDEESVRVVEPLAVLSIDGRWYLDAYCRRAEGLRRFRVDRVLSVAPAGDAEEASSRPSPDGPGVAGGVEEAAFVPGPDAVVAQVVVDEGGRWLLDAIPTLAVEQRPDGRATVSVAVASTVWFDRLLLRLGPHAEVVGPPALVDSGRRAARRLLGRYGIDPAGGAGGGA